MNIQKYFTGSFLIALALCSAGAGTAPAAQTAFKCEANTTTGAEQFSDAHYKIAATGNSGFKHVTIPPSTPIAVTATNANTAAGTTATGPVKVAGTLAGIEAEIECTTESGTGTLENGTSGSGMWASLVLATTYSGCVVTKPSGQGCVVTGGSVTTESLVATTEGQPANSVNFKPKSGTKMATFPISGCSTTALNNNFPLTGTLTATASGGTVSTTEGGVTAQNTLKLGGNKAGVGTDMTIKASSSAISFT